MVLSMSRPNIPQENAIAERFLRTFKEHQINKNTFQDEFFHQIKINSKFKGYRRLFNEYIQSQI